MSSPSTAAVSCLQCVALEDLFLQARDRLRNARRLRSLSPAEDRRLTDDVALVIARRKQHEAQFHGRLWSSRNTVSP